MKVVKTLLFCPYTGRPRHPSDIARDPEGLLIVEPGAPIMAYSPGAQRVAKVAAGKIAAGLKQIRSLWAHPDDIPAIRAYAKELANQRALRN